MRALLFDAAAGLWRSYDRPEAVLRAYSPAAVPGLLAEVEAAARRGRHAAGFLEYEAAPAFDPAFAVRAPAAGRPLAAFGLYARPEWIGPNELRSTGSCRTSALVPEQTPAAYRRKVAAVKTELAAGRAYQVNLTFRLRARFSGDPLAWFLERARRRPGDYPAYLEDGDTVLASLSPELFFSLSAWADGAAPGLSVRYLLSRPMKGTAAPGADPAAAAAALRADPKNRAENLMIVDLVRNDLGRVAEIGTVAVPELFRTETYPTVVQLTSAVTAKSRAGLAPIMAALFPAASITGAPKIAAMAAIRRLEPSPRGIYTGAIGWAAPDGSARFSVAIRTASFDRRERTLEYGVGGGIVWGSEPAAEWAEAILKAAAAAEPVPFEVYDALLLEDGAYFLRAAHLDRLEASCRFFGLWRGVAAARRRASVEARLDALASVRPHGRYKVRIVAAAGRRTVVACAPPPPLPSDYTIRLAGTPVDPADVFLAHKTNRRPPVDAALAAAGGAADVALVNTRGELTETSRGNLALELDGKLYTPPLESGILAGTYRAALIAAGELAERTLTTSDYYRADRIYMLNSVRRRLECRRLDASI